MGPLDLESPQKSAHDHTRNVHIRPYPICHENAPPYTLGHTSQSCYHCYSRENCNAVYGNSQSTLQIRYMDWCFLIFLGSAIVHTYEQLQVICD